MFYFLRLFDCFDKNNGHDDCTMAPPPPLHLPLYLNSRISTRLSTKLNTLRDTIDCQNSNIMHKEGLETYAYK